MKVSNLKPLMSAGGRENPPASDLSIRGTEGQDVAVEAKPDRRRLVWLGAAAGWARRHPRVRFPDPWLERNRACAVARAAAHRDGDRRALCARRLGAGHGGRGREPHTLRRRTRQHQLSGARGRERQGRPGARDPREPDSRKRIPARARDAREPRHGASPAEHRDPAPEPAHQRGGGPRGRADPRCGARAPTRAMGLGQGRNRRAGSPSRPG